MFDVEELKGQRVSERLSHTCTLTIQDPSANQVDPSIFPIELKLATLMYNI